MSEPDLVFLESIKSVLKLIEQHLDDSETISLLRRLIAVVEQTYTPLTAKPPFNRYISETFTTLSSRLRSFFKFPFPIYDINSYPLGSTIESVLGTWISQNLPNLKEVIADLEFQKMFFDSFGFFCSNIVLIGANGSGKTSLAENLRRMIIDSGVVISAQRLLKIPIQQSIVNVEKARSDLRNSQRQDKTYKSANDIDYSLNEFSILLSNLISENNGVATKFHSNALLNPEAIDTPMVTNLHRCINVWNSLITHRTLTLEEANLRVVDKNTNDSYFPSSMSEGEKVLLFNIAQVIQAPKDGMVVVDEPELYLHKSILGKIWDKLEFERNDCLFIYLTHDLDFAVSRRNAQKVWIKNYRPPLTWEFEQINFEGLPEALILEILGSRKNILFCEGTKSSIDFELLNILFPDATVIPVNSCSNVIQYSRAAREILHFGKNVYGIIDSDFRSPEQMEKLKDQNIYSYGVTEVENLFLLEEFLNAFATSLSFGKEPVINLTQAVIAEFKLNVEEQSALHVSSQINELFNESHVTKGRNFEEVERNLSNFTTQINVDKLFQDRREYLQRIAECGNYREIIQHFHNKGLQSFANREFSIKDFHAHCLRLLRSNPATADILRASMSIPVGKIC